MRRNPPHVIYPTPGAQPHSPEIVGKFLTNVYRENDTRLPGNTILFRGLNLIPCSTGKINKVFPSIHVFLCLLYKGKYF